MSTSFFQFWTFCLVYRLYACHLSLCESICVSVLLYLEDSFQASLTCIIFVPCLTHRFLSQEGKVLMKTSYLGQMCQCLLLSTHFPLVSFCVISKVLKEEAFLSGRNNAVICGYSSRSVCHWKPFYCSAPLAQ